MTLLDWILWIGVLCSSPFLTFLIVAAGRYAFRRGDELFDEHRNRKHNKP